MTLPAFSDASPTREWLINEQKRLHIQADKMMSTTKVMSVLVKYGQFSGIGGSYLYNTMIYPDLDVGIVTDTVTRRTVADLLSELTLNEYVRGIRTADTVNFNISKHPTKPRGYWIGIDIPFENDRWGIDCWLQQPDWQTDKEDVYTKKLANVDEEKKVAILSIKYSLIYRGLYGNHFLSGDVYDAVLDKGVKTIDEFMLLT